MREEKRNYNSPCIVVQDDSDDDDPPYNPLNNSSFQTVLPELDGNRSEIEFVCFRTIGELLHYNMRRTFPSIRCMKASFGSLPTTFFPPLFLFQTVRTEAISFTATPAEVVPSFLVPDPSGQFGQLTCLTSRLTLGFCL